MMPFIHVKCDCAWRLGVCLFAGVTAFISLCFTGRRCIDIKYEDAVVDMVLINTSTEYVKYVSRQ